MQPTTRDPPRPHSEYRTRPDLRWHGPHDQSRGSERPDPPAFGPDRGVAHRRMAPNPTACPTGDEAADGFTIITAATPRPIARTLCTSGSRPAGRELVMPTPSAPGDRWPGGDCATPRGGSAWSGLARSTELGHSATLAGAAYGSARCRRGPARGRAVRPRPGHVVGRRSCRESAVPRAGARLMAPGDHPPLPLRRRAEAVHGDHPGSPLPPDQPVGPWRTAVLHPGSQERIGVRRCGHRTAPSGTRRRNAARAAGG
jgi:hypothetical protein